MTEATMQVIKSVHGDEHTFALIPLSLNCPFVEAIYLPQEKKLAVISKTLKDTFHFFPRLDDNGDQIPAKRRVANRNPFKEERKPIQTFYEYYLSDITDINNFIDIHAHNPNAASTFLPKEKKSK